MKKQPKTNAMRILERKNIPYVPHEYETGDEALDGISVAKKTGKDPSDVFKTLVTKGVSGAVLVFCVPVARELDLKKAARAAGEKSVAMLPLPQITPLTGYVRGGCSPVGMKKAYPTFVDESAQGRLSVMISGGRIGLQVEVSPENLVKVADAEWASLCVEK